MQLRAASIRQLLATLAVAIAFLIGMVRPGGAACFQDADCDDGNVCNGPEYCWGGFCFGGLSLVCPGDGDACTDPVCDPERGCTGEQVLDRTNFGCLPPPNNYCDYDTDCVEHAICLEGRCTTGTRCGSGPPCPGGHDCIDGSCVRSCEIRGDCPCLVDEECPSGESCQGNVCLPQCSSHDECPEGTKCLDGQCVWGAPSCDDSDLCTADSERSDGTCEHARIPGCCHSSADCDDGNACNGSEFCLQHLNRCVVESRVAGCNDGDSCTTDTCNPADGTCTHSDVCTTVCNFDSQCDDLNPANGRETCRGGVCVADTPPDCDDRNPCTRDSAAARPFIGRPGRGSRWTCVHEQIPGCFETPCTGGGRLGEPTLVIKKTAALPDGILKLKGKIVLLLPIDPPLNPIERGMRVRVADVLGTAVLDDTLPGGSFNHLEQSGWLYDPSKVKWTYGRTTSQGIFKLVFKRVAGFGNVCRFTVKARLGSTPVPSLSQLPLKATLVVDSPIARDGQCGEASFVCPNSQDGVRLVCEQVIRRG